ncbi:hypothetical protein JXB41_00490 [Candidatus Woesearchaeota archaeon]|nr:hypothetical protein [Candidatus Woesearchaeota archaeon]
MNPHRQIVAVPIKPIHRDLLLKHFGWNDNSTGRVCLRIGPDLESALQAIVDRMFGLYFPPAEIGILVSKNSGNQASFGLIERDTRGYRVNGEGLVDDILRGREVHPRLRAALSYDLIYERENQPLKRRDYNTLLVLFEDGLEHVLLEAAAMENVGCSIVFESTEKTVELLNCEGISGDSLTQLTSVDIHREVESAIRTAGYEEIEEHLRERFGGFHYLYVGGLVRDAIIKAFYGQPYELQDLDVIVDDSLYGIDLFEKCQDLPGEIKANSFGNVSWRINGKKIHIFKYSTTKTKRDSPVSLSSWFEDCDFNVGTAAYCPIHKRVLSTEAIRGIARREITVIVPDPTRPYATACKAIDLANRLGFDLCPETTEYVREIYESAPEEFIRYASLKIPGERYQAFTNKLAEILN